MIISRQICDRKRIEEVIRASEIRLKLSPESEERIRIERRSEVLLEKTQQVARALPNEVIGIDCVQSFVSNMSAATTLEEVGYMEGITLPENIMNSTTVEWTSPKWAKAGDVVFFMHSKTARTTITRLRSELRQKEDLISKAEYDLLMSYLEHALEVHSKYGGKIFAIGRICGGPEYVESDDVIDNILHWRSRTYAAIDNIQILKNPIDISAFRDYIMISRGSAITPLFDHEFDRLRTVIGKDNHVPEYVKNAVARPIPLRLINHRNWIELANEYRRCFILEKQFRKFYVDYLLREIGDQRKFYTECRCQRASMNDSYMDYVMRFDGKYLPVETKLSVSAEPDIVGQVSKYVFNSKVFLTADEKRYVSGEDFHSGKVLIIDTEKMYIFDALTNRVTEIFDLDLITDRCDLDQVKQIIRSSL